MKDKDPIESRIIVKILELNQLMILNDISYDDLDLKLDREDKIIMQPFRNIDYNRKVDSYYFEKGLRIIQRVRKKVDAILKKREL